MNRHYRKPLRGVGINDASYEVYRKDVGICPFYKCWHSMINRCYSGDASAYKECTVCESWLTFSNFKKWMELQNWEGKHLDKDILIQGNKIYSPDSCAFVSRQVNNLFTDRFAERGVLPVGVTLRKSGSFKVNCNDGFGNLIYLGTYKKVSQAVAAYQLYKYQVIKLVASLQDNDLVKLALLNHKF